MSNIKRVKITGWVPFDIVSHEEVQPYFAACASPVINVHVKYEDEKFVPNEFGGKTVMFKFMYFGEEACSFNYFDKFVENLKKCGAEIDSVEIEDLEA